MCIVEGGQLAGKSGKKKTLSTVFNRIFVLQTKCLPHPTPHSYLEALTPDVMVFGSRASGQWLGLDEVLREGLVSLKKEEKRPGLSFCLYAMWGHNEKLVIYKQGRGPSPKT